MDLLVIGSNLTFIPGPQYGYSLIGIFFGGALISGTLIGSGFFITGAFGLGGGFGGGGRSTGYSSLSTG